MSPEQIRLIHIAAGAAGLDDARYRLLLANVAGVKSCKQLDNVGFEDVMATLEEMGFADRVHGAQYWRGKVQSRGRRGNERMVHKIRAMIKESRYELPALCERFSGYRTHLVEQLTPRECWNLIEMLKASIARESARAPRLFDAEKLKKADPTFSSRQSLAAERDLREEYLRNTYGVTDDNEEPF